MSTPDEPVKSGSDDLGSVAGALLPGDGDVVAQVIRASLEHSGPLPRPADLQAYEAVLPGLAERIVGLTEREQVHRHVLATRWLEREARLKDRGQWFALLALVAILGFCATLAWIGDTRTAGMVAVALVAAVVGIFVTGKLADRSSFEADTDQ